MAATFLEGTCYTLIPYPAGIYMFKVDNTNTKTKCEICSKLTIKTTERRHRRLSGVFIVSVSIVNFWQVNAELSDIVSLTLPLNM